MCEKKEDEIDSIRVGIDYVCLILETRIDFICAGSGIVVFGVTH